MSKFQILCVTMNQDDFSKIESMNIHSDVIFANQGKQTNYDEILINGHTAKMITTTTRGVGVNRNIALSYADAEICLFADDDIQYYNDLEEIVLSEFTAHPEADVFIFHLDTDVMERKLEKYSTTRKVRKFDRRPWGAVRVAFRLSSVRKTNVWFSTLFGGGALLPCGEDSIWIEEAKRKGLTFYVSSKTIGIVSCHKSSWFTGFDKKRFFAAGALYANLYPKTIYLWMIYFALRTKKKCSLSFKDKITWMINGKQGYTSLTSYEDYL